MKLLIVGASGLVGWNLLKAAQDRGHEAIGTYAFHPMPDLRQLHVERAESVALLLDELRPDAVICCLAWSWVDGCEREPERAFLENAERPALLARLAHQCRARFLHYSSSYVFDGNASPYDERASTNPISVYGKSKLLGEQKALEDTEGRALIVRTMGVYGEEPQQKNFVYQVVRNLRAGKPMSIPYDQLGNATYAGDLAAMSICLLEKEAGGVWNVAGPQPTDLCITD